MNEPMLTATEALNWNQTTSASWRKLLAAHPEILALPCDIARTATVAQLLQHIVAVELRYAERIVGLPETDYANVPYDSVEAIYATHDRAMEFYRQALDSETAWAEQIEFQTRSVGVLLTSRKTVLFHAVFHGIRHYAQLGTLVRQHGYKTDWYGDYLFMGATRAPSAG
ncbi:DinB family protein [Edaphobacter modestus]|uniref:Putative damage-inducible protein DinB n=1 Tax=Edaphobacter modestus TaxID=388466 RepID=A0A4Q7YY13_9BACT|nr:DinB family protein [Edaphobacter modestus]RZU42025.1 putative damage-inducible protein DinB [Edaphobacter modestus]